MTTKMGTGGVRGSGTLHNKPKMLQTKCLGLWAAAPQQTVTATDMMLGVALPFTARGKEL
jgi:hypothetical protein